MNIGLLYEVPPLFSLCDLIRKFSLNIPVNVRVRFSYCLGQFDALIQPWTGRIVYFLIYVILTCSSNPFTRCLCARGKSGPKTLLFGQFWEKTWEKCTPTQAIWEKTDVAQLLKVGRNLFTFYHYSTFAGSCGPTSTIKTILTWQRYSSFELHNRLFSTTATSMEL